MPNDSTSLRRDIIYNYLFSTKSFWTLLLLVSFHWIVKSAYHLSRAQWLSITSRNATDRCQWCECRSAMLTVVDVCMRGWMLIVSQTGGCIMRARGTAVNPSHATGTVPLVILLDYSRVSPVINLRALYVRCTSLHLQRIMPHKLLLVLDSGSHGTTFYG